MAGANRKNSISARSRQMWKTRLTKEEWREINSHVGLPVEAQRDIVAIINIYRGYQARIDALGEPAKIRKTLERIRKDVTFVRGQLVECFGDRDALNAPPSFFRVPQKTRVLTKTTLPLVVDPFKERAVRQRLGNHLGELEWLSETLAVSIQRLAKRKPGAKRQSEPAQLAVKLLNETLTHYTGEVLNRSKKRDDTTQFVSTILKIADPNIGGGTVTGAIRREIADRRSVFGRYRKRRG